MIFVLLLNITPAAHSQALWQKVRGGIAQVGSAISQLNIPGKLKEVAQSASSKITSSLKEKLEQVKNIAPNVIIPRLLENIEKLGNNIGYMANCMAKGSCSNQERAVFIGISITILALTAALIGLTIGIAATSKEVDAQVVKVSEEVKGWGPQAIFTRLKNTAAEFKQNLLNMRTCLLQRKCTSTQKKILYATAGTIAALATIAVGIGIGSYIYAHHKEQQRAAVEPQAGEPTREEGPILEQMAGFSETMPSWKTRFMQQVTKVIQPIKGVPQTLKKAYDEVQQQIKSGAIKTKQKAAQLFNELVAKGKSISDLIQETFNVQLISALNQLSTLKDQFVQFKDNLQEFIITKAQETGFGNMGKQFMDLAQYGQQISEQVDKADKAISKLGPKKVLIAKFSSEEKFKEKKQEYLARQEEFQQQKEQQLAQLEEERKQKLSQLEEEKAQLKKEMDAFYAAQAGTEATGSLPAKKPGAIKRIKAKIKGPKEAADESERIRRQMAEFQNRTSRLAQQEKNINDSIDQKIATLNKKDTEIQQKLVDLDNMILVDEVINTKFFNNIYPTILAHLKAVDLSPIGTIVNVVFVNLMVKALQAAANIHAVAGKIGAIVADEKVQHGLLDIATGVQMLGKFTQEALAVQPLITAPSMSTSEFIANLLITSIDLRVFTRLYNEVDRALLKAWDLRKNFKPLDEATKKLSKVMDNFQPRIMTKFKETINKAPLKNIPRATAILLSSLGEAIRDLKIALNDVFEKSSGFLNLALDIVPGVFLIAQTFNNVFGAAAGDALINPQFMQTVGFAISQAIPNINEGIKKLMQSLKEDMPEQEPETTLEAEG
jgi:hypothetical protein